MAMVTVKPWAWTPQLSDDILPPSVNLTGSQFLHIAPVIGETDRNADTPPQAIRQVK